MIDIRQMRYFVALAETLHFGRAAERLHVTQPPLSRQIAALEKELGVRLLERHSRHAKLTAAGERFLEDARAVLASFDEACRNAQRTDAGDLGELRIGFMMHAAYGVVPPLAKRFIAAHPAVRLHLREILPAALLAAVVRGDLDAGITFSPGPMRGLSERPVYRQALCLAVPAGHRLASGTEPVAASALAGEPLVTVPPDSVPVLRQAIEGWFAAAGMTPSIRLETGLQQTIVSLVAEGIGLALVPESMRRLGVNGVVFQTLVQAPVVEHVMVWRDANRNPVLPRWLAVLEG